ncbi:uncharacterized protein LOC110739500 [Chenopodium quinoa]|uniref:uncharacterized protein LOC110739500 n=1 Tax=Chenopodium quinoa TaxID=63459 RepID=UPI000B772B4B|nr:uncharacterized protein LOC110739500 [Chenopodium quinoa]
MLRTITHSEKEVVVVVHQVNIDRLNALLAEVMLRVDGLKVPLRKKQEEVKDANRREADLIDVTQYNTLMYGIKSKSQEMKQEELIKELTATMETTNKKAADFELQVKNLQSDVKALGDADKENTQLRADVSRLKNKLA